MNRIILLGFRYSGKSVIGEVIAKMHNLKFIDLDREIEKKENQSIADIVKKKGWKYFRELELNEYKEHLDKQNIVISCGGGFAVNEYFSAEEQAILHNDNGLKVLLEIDKTTLIERIKTSQKRPNFNEKNDIITENINTYNSRYEIYNSIDFDVKIDTSNENIANAIKNKTLCCVVGFPVWHSLSPKIHNFLYEINSLKDFVYTKCEIKPEKIEKLKEIVKTFNLRGVSITSPYKEKIMEIVDFLDEKAKQVGAVNTLFIDNGKIYGYNTDYIGVFNALANGADLKDKNVAIFGSGGGAKSAVIACLELTKNIVLFNRTKEKNDYFAKKNGIKSCSLDEFDSSKFDVIINATTVGLGTQKSIISRKQIFKNQVVFDMVYNPLDTKLLKNAVLQGAKIIYGIDMLIYQAIKQYEIYTRQTVEKQQILRLKKELISRNHNICLVVVGKTFKELIKNLKIAQTKSDFIEIRVDYLNKINEETVKNIADNVYKDCIFTCRAVNDGGNFSGTKKEQHKIIQYAMSLNKFTYFDIDFSQMEDWKYELNNKDKSYKIIVSHHNFKKCLSFKICTHFIDEMFKNGADIAKVACKVNSYNDICLMLKVLDKYKKENKDVIFAPMCENKTVRVLASNYGSWTNFVCLNGNKKTAKGQICIDDYKKVIDLLS